MNGQGISAPPTPGYEHARAPRIGIVGFWLALFGVVLPPLGVVGLVFAAMGLSKAKRTNLPTRLCLAGVILGAIGCVVVLALVVQWVLGASPQ